MPLLRGRPAQRSQAKRPAEKSPGGSPTEGHSARNRRFGVGIAGAVRAPEFNERLHALKLARMSTARGTVAVMADSFARLHVIFSFSHFSLFAAPLNQFAEPSDRFLNGFAVPELHVNHRLPLVRRVFKLADSPRRALPYADGPFRILASA